MGSFVEWWRRRFGRAGASNAKAKPAPPAKRRFATTAAEVTGDSSYAHVWTSPGSHIAYYVKAVLTPELLAMTDPPFHRRILMQGEPESYVYCGILNGRVVEQPPQADMTALGLRVSLGTGLPFIHTKPKTLV